MITEAELRALIDESSFSARDLFDQDVWTPFTPVFSGLTAVGATAYSGRYRFVGRQCFGQVKFSAATSVASVDGTTYLQLPCTALGLAGSAQLMNDTTIAEVAGSRVKVSTSRVYLPAIVATANVFALSWQVEA